MPYSDNISDYTHLQRVMKQLSGFCIDLLNHGYPVPTDSTSAQELTNSVQFFYQQHSTTLHGLQVVVAEENWNFYFGALKIAGLKIKP